MVQDSAGNWQNSSSTITFNLPSGTSLSGTASLYLGFASDYYSAIIVKVNTTTLVSNGSTVLNLSGTLNGGSLQIVSSGSLTPAIS